MVHRIFLRVLREVKFCFLALICLLNPLTEGKTLVHRDKLGRLITLEVPVKRAVVLSGCEILPALNCWDKVAGISRWAFNEELTRKSIERSKRKIPVMGSASDVNLEAVLKVNPDVVITWTHKPELVKFMQERGLKVISIDPESIKDLFNTIDLFGKLFGREKEANNAKQRMKEIFLLISKCTKDIKPQERKRVLWLWGSPTRVAGSRSLEGWMINEIKAINPAEGYKSTGADVSLERIIKWNPDVIFIWGYAKYSVEDIINNPQWKTIKAVRNKAVYKAPYWSSWSPRLALITLWMASKVYPEKFRSYDFSKICDDFYKKVFSMNHCHDNGWE
ncbi:MAG: ABC transporter substrate-binding protein [bacterium]